MQVFEKTGFFPISLFKAFGLGIGFHGHFSKNGVGMGWAWSVFSSFREKLKNCWDNNNSGVINAGHYGCPQFLIHPNSYAAPRFASTCETGPPVPLAGRTRYPPVTLQSYDCRASPSPAACQGLHPRANMGPEDAPRNGRNLGGGGGEGEEEGGRGDTHSMPHL